jgi:hypothetical protein
MSNKVSGQYSDATLTGPWLIHFTPISPYNDSLLYIIFDGSGSINDMSGFCGTVGGTYSVTVGGAITANIVCDADNFPFTGQLTSSTTANLLIDGDAYTLTKVSNPSSMTDTLEGTLYTENCGTKNIMLAVDASGMITYSTGLIPIVSGRIYADQGVFIGHFKTGEVSNWNQFTIAGYQLSDSLLGEVYLDASSCGITWVKLYRRSAPASINNYDASDKIAIEPNPAHGKLFIRSSEGTIDIISVYNALGVLMIKSDPIQLTETCIDISAFANGLYFLKILSGNTVITKRIVKN